MPSHSADAVARSLLTLLRDIRKRYSKQLQTADREAIDAAAADAAAVLKRPPPAGAIDLDRITHLRASGRSWADIENELGITRQAAQKAMKAVR